LVIDIDFAAGGALLCCPEWHPARPVTSLARMMPAGTQPGDWLSGIADLSAAPGAQLKPRATCAPR